jgi:ABC-2 type transport system permease protein
VNGVVAGITLRGLLGRRRALLLVLLPASLLALAVAIALVGRPNNLEVPAAQLLQHYGLGTLLPLIALIVTTGVLGTEIDEGSIVFLLSRPISRPVILHTKLAIAIGVTAVCAALPVLLAGVVMVGGAGRMAVGFAVGALAGAIAYSAIFLAINVLTRHAVVVGLLYALVWESLVGGYVPGARELSVQQWALSLADWPMPSTYIASDVAPMAAVGLLAATTVVATVLAGQRLRSLSIAGES